MALMGGRLPQQARRQASSRRLDGLAAAEQSIPENSVVNVEIRDLPQIGFADAERLIPENSAVNAGSRGHDGYDYI